MCVSVCVWGGGGLDCDRLGVDFRFFGRTWERWDTRLACLFCCSQPLCVVSQQSIINFPILLPPPPKVRCRSDDEWMDAISVSAQTLRNLATTLFSQTIRALMVGGCNVCVAEMGGGGGGGGEVGRAYSPPPQVCFELADLILCFKFHFYTTYLFLPPPPSSHTSPA